MLRIPARASVILLGLLICLGVGVESGRALLSHALRQEFDRAISKWVARDRAGKYYVLDIESAGSATAKLTLRVAKGETAASLEDFSDPITLPTGVNAPDRILSAGMVIDAADHLHLVWNTENGLTAYTEADLGRITHAPDLGAARVWVNPTDHKRGAQVLASAGSRLGDISLGPEGGVWIAWATEKDAHQVSVYLGHGKHGQWHPFRIADGYGLAPPSLLLDSEGDFHLGWHDVYEDAYYVSGKTSELGQGQPLVPAKITRPNSYHPLYRSVMMETDHKTLAIFENAESYLEYAFPEEPKLKLNPLARRDPRLMWDTDHSPQVAIDRYGIPWVFFIDSVRRHVFYMRWLGTEWSEVENSYWLTRNSPRMEDNHLAIDRIAVEPRMAATSTGIGIALKNESEFPAVTFHTFAVPSLAAEPGKKVLFLDLLELAGKDRLELRVNAAEKYADNPVIGPGGPNDFDSLRAGNFLRVLKVNGVYRMWYAALHIEPHTPWPNWDHVGYAESADGLKFHRVNLGLAAFHGNDNTNLIPSLPYVTFVNYDAHESNPERRYKALKFRNTIMADDEARAGLQDPWSDTIHGKILTSPDGIHWKDEPAEMRFLAGRGGTEIIPQSFFYDEIEKDPDRKYKAYGYSSLNLARRGGTYIYSPDAVHWTAYPQNPVLDPFARCMPVVRGGKIHQIHDTVAWREGDYYLALYQYQHGGDPAPDLDIELAASRDGENFEFVGPGQRVLTRGRPGEWDCDEVTATTPFHDGNQIKLYYGGICGGENGKGAGGLAALRLDGFTNLQLGQGRQEGSLTTIPIARGHASQLWVNADCGANGYLEIELLDAATGRPLPGFSREEAVRISGDVMANSVQWKQQSDLHAITAQQFQVKVHFVGGQGYPKLYSFGFK